MKNLKRLLITAIAGIAFATSSGCITSTKYVKPDQNSIELFQAQYPEAEYRAEGFKAPDLAGCKVLLKEYARMPEGSIPQGFRDMYKTNRLGGYNPEQFTEDENHNLAYIVQFKNKQGTIIKKFYHKTHPFAFTIKEQGKKPYTIIAEKANGPYYLKLPWEFKHETYDTSHWTLKHPEPDDFNPNTDDPFPERDNEWFKACEWHKKTEAQ